MACTPPPCFRSGPRTPNSSRPPRPGQAPTHSPRPPRPGDPSPPRPNPTPARARDSAALRERRPRRVRAPAERRGVGAARSRGTRLSSRGARGRPSRCPAGRAARAGRARDGAGGASYAQLGAARRPRQVATAGPLQVRRSPPSPHSLTGDAGGARHRLVALERVVERRSAPIPGGRLPRAPRPARSTPRTTSGRTARCRTRTRTRPPSRPAPAQAHEVTRRRAPASARARRGRRASRRCSRPDAGAPCSGDSRGSRARRIPALAPRERDRRAIDRPQDRPSSVASGLRCSASPLPNAPSARRRSAFTPPSSSSGRGAKARGAHSGSQKPPPQAPKRRRCEAIPVLGSAGRGRPRWRAAAARRGSRRRSSWRARRARPRAPPGKEPVRRSAACAYSAAERASSAASPRRPPVRATDVDVEAVRLRPDSVRKRAAALERAGGFQLVAQDRRQRQRDRGPAESDHSEQRQVAGGDRLPQPLLAERPGDRSPRRRACGCAGRSRARPASGDAPARSRDAADGEEVERRVQSARPGARSRSDAIAGVKRS